MWKYLLIVTALFASCSVDELPPCNGSGVSGEICKEYQYVYGSFNGSNYYEYTLGSDLVTRKITKGKNGSEEGTTVYEYDSLSRVTTIYLEDMNGRVLTEKTFEYNDAGLLLKEKVEGQTNTTFEVAIENDFVIAEKFKEGSKTLWVDSLEYFSGTRNLYRKIRFVSGEIYQITYFEDYSNNVKEEKITNSNGVIQSKRVMNFDGSDNMVEELFYSETGSLIKRTVYTYVEGLLDRVESYNESGTEFERLEYQRF